MQYLATQERGSKQYELTDHLGNIRTVVGDIKEPHLSGLFRVPTQTLNNYYPYGMLQSGRSVSTGAYRFGFNGMEQTAGVQGNGQGTFYDYKNRDYDPWKIRFNRTDPITAQYPMLTPYQFASNTPIQAIDLDGLEAWNITKKWDDKNIFAYKNYVTKQVEQYKRQGDYFWCEDLALSLIIDFAAANGLPFTFTNGVRDFNASTSKLSFNDFKNEVLKTSAAPDIAANTVSLRDTREQDSGSTLNKADLLIWKTGSVPSHVQIVVDFFYREDPYSYNALIAQGNGNRLPKHLKNSNPNSVFYGGSLVQYGKLDLETGRYVTLNDDGTENDGHLYSNIFRQYNFFGGYSTEIKQWDFQKFNTSINLPTNKTKNDEAK